MTINIPASVGWSIFVALITIAFLIGLYKNKIDDLCRKFPKIETAVILILETLKLKDILRDLVSADSPLHLTPKGKQMLEESGFYDFFNANRDYLIGEVKKLKPKVKFDIEEAAKKVMFELPGDRPEFGPIKEYAYEKGRQISGLLFVYAIYLRDEVIKELNPPPVEPAPKSD